MVRPDRFRSASNLRISLCFDKAMNRSAKDVFAAPFGSPFFEYVNGLR